MLLKFRDYEIPVESKCAEGTLFIAISGSHAFGWDNKNSDLDIIFVEFIPMEQLVSPFYRHTTRQRQCGIYDKHMYPIQDYLRLLAKGNGNALDNLFEPKIYQKENLVKSLQAVVKEELHIGFIDHCLGYALSIRKDLFNQSRLAKYGAAKLLLTRYRVLLQGMLILDGKIEYNLVNMDKLFKGKYLISDILSLYLNNISDNSIFDKGIQETDTLQIELVDKKSKCKLPHYNQSTIKIALNRWIVKYYLKGGKYERS